ncbi:ABC transporter ATP-binding protein/permease [Nocardia sp. CDC159]|uniref:ABC transporter ATP-binding protein/permease n=1 Tax=Nocardia pulmonis TaxID=2951408 RepID=A0A9X2E163_9NOCA|nr:MULTISPECIES: ABC transporter ATP-binding protein [Nocardia]MCM6771949.1 ABC transporter ATP-binding protein/permease [Nocardia pulmonis]MCM6785393.1 ABC transporter ATP-binding protein/permease [Nocardia sp. CDC159]
MSPDSGRAVLRIAVSRNAGAMAAGGALLTLYQAAETAVPVVLGLVVDRAIVPGSLTGLILGLLALAAVIGTVSYSWRFGMRILQRANTTEAHRWRVAVADRVLRPVPPELDLQSGETLIIATDDADQTADIVEVVPQLVSSLLAVAVIAGVLTVLSPPLGLLVVGGTAAILTILGLISRRIGAATEEQQARIARAGAAVSDLVAGLRPLHGFGGNAAAYASYRRRSAAATHQAITVANTSALYTGIGLALNAVLTAAVTVTAAWLAFAGTLSLGQFVIAVGLAQFVAEPLRLFSEMPKYVMQARASAERVALVLAARPAFEPGEKDPRPGDLEVVGEPSFRVPPGEFVAVVAAPRIAADLTRALAVTTTPDDTLRLTGRPFAEFDPARLRRHVLVSPHHGEIFAGTLRSNIDPADTGADVERAADAAALSDLVRMHEAGLDHPVGDRGANLSGGQRQRLLLARALAADPEVLVLHDPTTAVDAVTEERIARTLADHRRSRTTLVFTSSPALLDVADRVLVLDGPRVVAEGTHRALVAEDPAYRAAVLR